MMRTFTLRWGSLDVYFDGAVPESATRIAAVAAALGGRYRVAVLRMGRGGSPVPFLVVWPGEVPSGVGELSGEDMAGALLAEVPVHRCSVCEREFRVVYPAGGLPFFSDNLGLHELVNGCPDCGAEFSRSRVQGLAVLPVDQVRSSS